LWEFPSRHSTDGDEVLETIEEGVWGRGAGRVSRSKGKASHVVDSLGELGKDDLVREIKNLSVENTTVLKDLLDFHLIFERIDLQFIEELSFSSTDLVTGSNNLLLLNNINLGLNNLGLDVEGLEE